jgi:hypothetical protein
MSNGSEMAKMNETKTEGSELGKGEDDVKSLKSLVKIARNVIGTKDKLDIDSYAASLKVLKRVMDLSMEDLKEEAVIEEGGVSAALCS